MCVHTRAHTHTHNPYQNHVGISIPWRQNCALPLIPTKGTHLDSEFQFGNSKHRWNASSDIPPASKSHLSKSHLFKNTVTCHSALESSAPIHACMREGGSEILCPFPSWVGPSSPRNTNDHETSMEAPSSPEGRHALIGSYRTVRM